jgi:hypothetical protein
VAPPLAVKAMSAFGAASPNSARSGAFGSTSRVISSDVRLPIRVVTSVSSASVATGSMSFHVPSVFFRTEVSPLAVIRSSSTSSLATVKTFSLASVSGRFASTK